MKTKVLVVEDEGLIALDLKSRLEQAGYQVPAPTDNFEGALSGVEREHPSIVLMDIRLRGKPDGIQAADCIRKRFDVPVIFVTAYADRETLKRARITEPFGYIVKPFLGVDFRAQIEIALSRHTLERKLRNSEALFSATYHGITDGLITADTAGIVTLMNAPGGELTGWSPALAIGKHLSDVFRISDEATGQTIVLPPDPNYTGELTGSRRTYQMDAGGGSGKVAIEAVISVNRSEDTVSGIVVAFRDITDRRKAEQYKLQQQKMDAITDLAGGLVGELTESQGAVDDLLAALIDNASLPDLERLEKLNRLHARLRGVVQLLQALSRKETGNPLVLDVNEMLRSMEVPWTRILGRFRPLKLHLQPGPLFIAVDSEGFKVALTSLMSAVRQLTGSGETVTVSAAIGPSLAGGEPVVRVQIGNVRAGTAPGASSGAKISSGVPSDRSRLRHRASKLSLLVAQNFASVSGASGELENNANGVAYSFIFPLVRRVDPPFSPAPVKTLAKTA